MSEPVLPTEAPRCPFENCDPSEHRELVASGWDFEYDTTREESSIVSCSECGIWHLARIPRAEAMSRIYPQNYYAYDEAGRENALVKWVRDRLEHGKIARYRKHLPRRAIRVLDIGCGDGRLLDIFRNHGPDDWEYAGIEIGEQAAETARSKGYDVRSGDFESVDTSDWAKRFDLILMHQVIEHLRGPGAAVARVRDMLRPEGIFSIETPDTQAWDANFFRRRYWGGYHFPRHFYLFHKASLAKLVRDKGFEVAHSQSIVSPVFWVHSVHNWLIEQPRLARFAPIFNYQNVMALSLATGIDALQLLALGRSSNQQLLARKPAG